MYSHNISHEYELVHVLNPQNDKTIVSKKIPNIGGVMNSLEIRNLYKTYRWKTVAMDGLDLEVPTGSIFGMLGSNGADKSTTMNILAGVVKRAREKFLYWGR